MTLYLCDDCQQLKDDADGAPVDTASGALHCPACQEVLEYRRDTGRYDSLLQWLYRDEEDAHERDY